MPGLPTLVSWTLGAIGAVVLVRLLNREWRRVNAELDRIDPVRVTHPEYANAPKLRRDPESGVYSPAR